MRIARIARPDAIYDASAASQTFSEKEMIEVTGEGGDNSEEEEQEGGKSCGERRGGRFRKHAGIYRVRGQNDKRG